MSVQRFSSIFKTRRPCRAVAWWCLLTGLCVLMLTFRPGERKVMAHAAQLPSTSTGQLGISPEDPVPERPPVVIPQASSQQSSNQGAKNSGGEAGTPKWVPPAIPAPDPKNPVAVQTAELLKMAYSLKAEVDKTTKDMLSVPVVRQAGEIEQMAHKMRSK
jgi:hypothetical protein